MVTKSKTKKSTSSKKKVSTKKVVVETVTQQDVTFDLIINTMKSVNQDIINSSIDTLIDTKDLLEKKSSDYGAISPALDILGSLTGYDKAGASLGEVAALTRVLSKLLRFMTLRASKKPNFESLADTTKDLVGECTRLHTIYSFNMPEKENN